MRHAVVSIGHFPETEASKFNFFKSLTFSGLVPIYKYFYFNSAHNTLFDIQEQHI